MLFSISNSTALIVTVDFFFSILYTMKLNVCIGYFVIVSKVDKDKLDFMELLT